MDGKERARTFDHEFNIRRQKFQLFKKLQFISVQLVPLRAIETHIERSISSRTSNGRRPRRTRRRSAAGRPHRFGNRGRNRWGPASG